MPLWAFALGQLPISQEVLTVTFLLLQACNYPLELYEVSITHYLLDSCLQFCTHKLTTYFVFVE